MKMPLAIDHPTTFVIHNFPPEARAFPPDFETDSQFFDRALAVFNQHQRTGKLLKALPFGDLPVKDCQRVARLAQRFKREARRKKGLPSAEDLDRMAAEEEVRKATKGEKHEN